MRRMSLGKRYGRGQWLGTVGILIITLTFGVVKELNADCTSGSPLNDPSVWGGDWVPYQLFPPNAPRGNNKYAKVVFYGVGSCFPIGEGWGYFNDCVNHFLGTSYHKITSNPACGGGWGLAYEWCYAFKDDSQANHDYDCDGIPDSADSHPATAENREKNAGRPPNFICPIKTDTTNTTPTINIVF